MKKNDESRVTIRLDQLFDGVAKLDELAQYEDRALALAGSGREVVLTGPAPVWLYLRLAHGLHGRAGKLLYRSPVTGDVLIFNHDPF